MELKKALKIDDILEAFEKGTNLCDLLDDEDLKTIGADCHEGYINDLQSRSEWEGRYSQGMKLALQVFEIKNTPWEKASNVKFPAITIPAVNFNSRVYSALISGTEIVRMRTIGEDQSGEKEKRARRVSTHMSYQVLEQDQDWEPDHDRMLIALPLTGCEFIKTYHDSHKKHLCGKHVFSKDLVMDYYTTSLDTSPRISHRFTETENDIRSKIRQKIYSECDFEGGSNYEPSNLDIEQTQREGRSPGTGKKPWLIVEQHCWLDLDGDQYEEPYCVTFREQDQKVLRIYPRFSTERVEYTSDKEVAKINPIQYFTKYGFIPSPDGSIYDIGFFTLLGPLNEAINTLINQLVDRGTLNIKGGGFVSRGARLKAGPMKFQMGELKELPVSADDIRKAIFLMPTVEPSNVLYNLLNLLIEYTQKTSSVSDMMMGQTPGQNTPATTAMAALEQGQQVFAGIYKRCFRSLTQEFRLRYELNRLYLDPVEYYEILDSGQQGAVAQSDYEADPKDIRPTADPNVTSAAQRMAKAEAVAARSQQYHGYDRHKVEIGYLEALQMPGIGALLPTNPDGTPKNPAPEDPKTKIMELDFKRQATKDAIDSRMKQELIDAQIGELETRAMLNLAKAEAEEAGEQIELYKLQIADLRERRENLRAMLDVKDRQQGPPGAGGGLEGMAGAPSNQAGAAVPA